MGMRHARHCERGTYRARHVAEEFIEQVTALERRLNERFDLLERLVALGFDDTTDQLRLRLSELDAVRERKLFGVRGA